ncbi:MAG TPA: hypothetical protein VHC69_21840 [Polyangiaceae bacterium]|nr:hypothetical protein [Polyangiaceae bacterium]
MRHPPLLAVACSTPAAHLFADATTIVRESEALSVVAIDVPEPQESSTVNVTLP